MCKLQRGRLAGVAVGIAGLVLTVWMSGRAVAAGADEGLIVQGIGITKTRPTQVEIFGSVSAEAELAADATVKFRDARKRALAAFAALKNPDLKVVAGGVSVSSAIDANAQMMMMRGMPVASPTSKVRLVEMDHLVLANTDKLESDVLLDKILKILDVAKDAGFQVGPPQATNYYELRMLQMQGNDGNNEQNATVLFKLADGVPFRNAAYKAAIADAREKAQKLAELSGVKLGRVLSLDERGEEGAEKAVAGSSTGDLTLRIVVTVQFEILK